MDEFYTVKQAAITLKVHPLTIRRYIKEGKLKAYRAGGNIRIALADLRTFPQGFIIRHKQFRGQQVSRTRPFSLTDPLLGLKGKGFSSFKFKED